MTTVSVRRALGVLLLVALALAAPSTSVSASAVDTFVRFEENAQANWVVTQDCGDGTTARLLVTVIGGREFESPDLEDVNTFATVLIRGVDCEGNLVNDRGSGPATYTGSPSLQEAHLVGTVTTRQGRVVELDVTWEGTGGLETSVNNTTFDGFVGIFTSKEREATASGTVVVDGETLVSGPTQSAHIETLEDRNTTLP
ncbi:MAG TPA: hypothetical protein VHF27_04125 [Acidimicrobiales bacterium]|nr:hypothetical protein [Acidimicrobiales bacterium]